MKIGVISDTHAGRHDQLPQWIKDAFVGVDLILHAGDIEAVEILDQLSAIAPCQAVRGNMDHHCWELPQFRRVPLPEGCAVIAHRYEEAARHIHEDVVLLIHGHSHVPAHHHERGYLLVNPGSACRPRGGSRPSVAVLHISGRTIEAEFMNSPDDADK